QKSRILVSELVYQSIRPVSAKARRGIRAMPAAVPAAEIIKVRRFILLSHLDDSRRASTLLPILEVAHRPMAEGRIQNGMYPPTSWGSSPVQRPAQGNPNLVSDVARRLTAPHDSIENQCTQVQCSIRLPGCLSMLHNILMTQAD